MAKFRMVATARKLSTAAYLVESDSEAELEKLAHKKANFDKTTKWKTELFVTLSDYEDGEEEFRKKHEL
jgi:hypothetical protein